MKTINCGEDRVCRMADEMAEQKSSDNVPDDLIPLQSIRKSKQSGRRRMTKTRRTAVRKRVVGAGRIRKRKSINTPSRPIKRRRRQKPARSSRKKSSVKRRKRKPKQRKQ